jgi:hypothetical protein
MKKLSSILFAALLVAVFTLPAAAVEHEFGGYWRTRFFMNRDFSGSSDRTEDERLDRSEVDTRTRLYYTAILNDNLKLVNKFEMNANWGNGNDEEEFENTDGDDVTVVTSSEYGDIGTDGLSVLVKNSYADATFGIVNTKVGAQGAAVARGFLFDADFAGVVLNFDIDAIKIPLYWIRMDEGGVGKDANDGDADMYGISPSFGFGGVSINPLLFWATTQDAGQSDEFSAFSGVEKINLYFLGVNADVTFGPAKAWFTGIYEDGKAEAAATGADDLDVSAFLVALGGGANFGMFEAHGQVFYATGDDDDEDDDEITEFYVPNGQSYYWSEIMGLGTFDDQTSNGSPGDQIFDILAVGLGGSVSPMEKLTIGLDIWYAQRAEKQDPPEDSDDEKKLGTEVDFTVTYTLLEDLNLKVVAAYLFAGEGTDPTDDNDDTANPFELGAQISFGF